MIRYEVVGVTKTSYVTGPAFASCKISTTGGTCNISSAKAVTRSVQVSLGATRGFVSGSLGFSAGASVTTTVACTSPPLKAGESAED